MVSLKNIAGVFLFVVFFKPVFACKSQYNEIQQFYYWPAENKIVSLARSSEIQGEVVSLRVYGERMSELGSLSIGYEKEACHRVVEPGAFTEANKVLDKLSGWCKDQKSIVNDLNLVALKPMEKCPIRLAKGKKGAEIIFDDASAGTHYHLSFLPEQWYGRELDEYRWAFKEGFEAGKNLMFAYFEMTYPKRGCPYTFPYLIAFDSSSLDYLRPNALAYKSMANKDYGLAQEQLDKSRSIFTNYWFSNYNQACLLALTGQPFEKGKHHLGIIFTSLHIQLSPKNVDANGVNRLNCQIETYDRNRLISSFFKKLRTDPDLSPWRREPGYSQWLKEREEEYFEKPNVNQVSMPEAVAKSLYYKANGNYEAAAASFAMNPEDWTEYNPVLVEKAAVEARMGKTKESFNDLCRAVEKHPAWTREKMESDEDFDPIRGNPIFQKVLGESTASAACQSILTDGPASPFTVMVESYLKQLDSPSPDLRAKAMSSLGGVLSQGRPELEKVLKGEVAHGAFPALLRMAREDVNEELAKIGSNFNPSKEEKEKIGQLSSQYYFNFDVVWIAYKIDPEAARKQMSVRTLLSILRAEGRDDSIGLREADAIIRAKGESALPDIIAALKDETLSRVTREGAVSAAGLLGPIAAPAVEPLLSILREQDRDRSNAILGVLLQIGRGAVPGMIKTMKDADRPTRIRIILTLGKMGDTAKDAVPGLTEVLKGSDYILRGFAREALRKIGTPEASAVVRAFNQEMDDTAESANKITPQNIRPATPEDKYSLDQRFFTRFLPGFEGEDPREEIYEALSGVMIGRVDGRSEEDIQWISPHVMKLKIDNAWKTFDAFKEAQAD